MSEYLEIIKTSIFTFPFIAFLFTLPYILYQYHKYGSIYYLRVIIIYSFILYLLTAYFLVILPLPTIEEVSQLTTPRVQLVPFQFVFTFIRETSFQIADVHTYWKAFLEPCCYVVFYNLLLCLPFGAYLRYYFQFSLKKTILFTFLLSLFFELTQLTGLYFIYPRGYRLFDVDDLILNTFGGVLGYCIASLFMKFLPSRNKIDEKSYLLGQKVSFLKRFVAFGVDGVICLLFVLILSIFNHSIFSFYGGIMIYYFIIPMVTSGRTLAFRFLNLKIESRTSDLKFYQILIRQFFWIVEIFILPYLSLSFFLFFVTLWQVELFGIFLFLFGLFLFFYFLMISILILCKRPLLYERISKTFIVSTISKK